MAQAVDNLTALTVRLLEVGPHPRLTGWDRAVAELLGTTPVTGRADLLSRRTGERVELAVRHDLVKDVVPGTVVRLRAKLASGEIMAESCPDEGDFSIAPF